MDVGPLFIPHAQAAKLIEPGKGALHDPPPPAQATPMLGAAHGKLRHDMPRPQPAPKGGRVAAVLGQALRQELERYEALELAVPRRVADFFLDKPRAFGSVGLIVSNEALRLQGLLNPIL